MVETIMDMDHAEPPLPAAFLAAAASYWLGVWPQARGELRRWRARARSTPDPTLRLHALETLEHKWSNVEGAAALAVLAPSRYRSTVIRALVSWQAIYDLADTLSENSSDRAANSHQLHQALLIAVCQPAAHPDYYAQHPTSADNRYMRALVDAARIAFDSLPSHMLTAAAAQRAARRIATYQALHHAGAHEALANWAKTHTPSGTDLRWWETSAASASSLAALAMITVSADRSLLQEDASAIENVYWPWAGALHTLLDSLTDLQEDTALGQRSLLDYATSKEIRVRMHRLSIKTSQQTERLPRPRKHAILITGMTSLYLSAPEAHLPAARPIAESILAVAGSTVGPAITILRARRTAMRIGRRIRAFAETRASTNPPKPQP